MPMRWKDVERLARGMRNYDEGSWCLFYTLLLSFVIGLVGIFVYAFNAKLVAYYILLVPCALWLFLIFCGWAIKPGLNPFSDLPTCLWCCSCVWTVVFGITALCIFEILHHYKQENKVNFDASNATLAQFNFTSSNISNILSYNLSLDVTVGPNKKKTGVYYHNIQAWAFYQGHNFTSLSIPPFYVGGKKNHTYNSTVVLHPVFQGQQAVVLTGDGLRRYQKETAARLYSIDVTMSYLGIRTNDYNDHKMTATDSNDTLNEAGHQLKGVVTFGLKVPQTSDVTPHSGATDRSASAIAVS